MNLKGITFLAGLLCSLSLLGQSIVHTNLSQPLGNKTVVGTNALKFQVLSTNSSIPGSGLLTLFARTNDLGEVRFFSRDSAGSVTELGSGSAVGYYGNSLWVDAVYGDDSTAVVGRHDRPWLTIQAAASNMTHNSVLVVRPGVYTASPDPGPDRLVYPNRGCDIRFQNLTNIAVIGHGATIQADDDGNIVMFQNVTNAIFQGFTLVGQGITNGINAYAAVLLDGTNKFVSIRENYIRNIGAHGVATLWDQHASDFVEVTGNRFETGGSTNSSLGYDGTAIPTGGRDWIISGNHVRDWFRAVEFYTSGSNEISRIVVDGNVFENCWEATVLGIPPVAITNGINNLVIANNVFRGPAYPPKSGLPGPFAAIAFQGGSHLLIANNTITNYGPLDLYITNSATGAYDTNAYATFQAVGIRLDSILDKATHNIITGNKVTGIRLRGIELIKFSHDNAYNIISDNIVYKAEADGGIYVFGASDTLVSGNLVMSSPTGILLEGSTNSFVTGNTLVWNGSAGLYIKTNDYNVSAFGNIMMNNNGGSSNPQIISEGTNIHQLLLANVQKRSLLLNGVPTDVTEPALGWTNGLLDSFIQLHNALTTNETGVINQYGQDWRIYSTTLGPGALRFVNQSKQTASMFFDGEWGRTLVGNQNPGLFGPTAQLEVHVATNANLAREKHMTFTGRDFYTGTNAYSTGTNGSTGVSLLLFSQGATNKMLMVSDTDWDTTTNDNSSINIGFEPYWGRISALYTSSNLAALTLRGTTVKMPHLPITNLVRVNAQGELTNAVIGSGLSFDGTTLSATGGAGGSVYVNGSLVTDPNFTNSATAVLAVTSSTNVTVNPTNLTSAQLATDSVSADELNAAGVESELEAVLDFVDLQGALTAFNPNQFATNAGTISVDSGALITNAIPFDSWSSFTTDIDWDASSTYLITLTSNPTFTFSNNSDGQRVGLILKQDATGGRIPTWPAGLIWWNATNQSTTSPQLNTNANALNFIDLFRVAGTNYAFGPSSSDSTNLTWIAALPAQTNTYLAWHSDGSGVYYITNKTVPAASATAWDDIGDPDADTTIALAGFETTLTTSLDEAAGAVISIENSDAEGANDTAFLQLLHNDGADANVIYLYGIGDADGTDTTDYKLSQTEFLVGDVNNIIPTKIAGEVNAGSLMVTNTARFENTALAYSGSTNITVDLNAGSTFYLTVTNTAFFTTPSNVPSSATTNQTIYVFFKMDGTGGYSITFTNGTFKFPGGTVPTITTNANAVSMLTLTTSPFTAGQLYGVSTLDIK